MPGAGRARRSSHLSVSATAVFEGQRNPPGRAAPHPPQEAGRLSTVLVQRLEAPRGGATEQGGGGAQAHLFGIRRELSTVGQKAATLSQETVWKHSAHVSELTLL